MLSSQTLIALSCSYSRPTTYTLRPLPSNLLYLWFKKISWSLIHLNILFFINTCIYILTNHQTSNLPFSVTCPNIIVHPPGTNRPDTSMNPIPQHPLFLNQMTHFLYLPKHDSASPWHQQAGHKHELCTNLDNLRTREKNMKYNHRR